MIVLHNKLQRGTKKSMLVYIWRQEASLWFNKALGSYRINSSVHTSRATHNATEYKIYYK